MVRFSTDKNKTKFIIIEGKEYNLKIKDTKDDGNCFYSSIYRSLQQKDLLKKVFKKIPEVKSINENTFIRKFRNEIAERSEFTIIEMFNNFCICEFDKNTFKEIVKYLGSISTVLTKYYKNKKYKTEYQDEFIYDIKKSIRRYSNWVGQLEVENILKILKDDCNINVKIFSNYKKAVKDIKNDSDKKFKNTLYILNCKEVHYVYI
jgi:hypothetical protein